MATLDKAFDEFCKTESQAQTKPVNVDLLPVSTLDCDRDYSDGEVVPNIAENAIIDENDNPIVDELNNFIVHG